VAGQGPIYRGRGVAASLFDWPRWVAAHLVIGVVGRQGLEDKEMRREGWPNFLAMAGSFLTTTSEQTKCNATS
jgi:hypothetical protein